MYSSSKTLVMVKITRLFSAFAIVKKKKKAIIMVFHIYPFLHLFVKGGFIYLWGIMGAI